VPGCDFTRRDFLRWTGVAAASPLVAKSALLSGVARIPMHRDDISPVNLELVTLTEDRAIITWYTGYTGTDDGLGRMKPAPADGEVYWGTNPNRLHRVAGDRGHTPYHYVELRGLEPGQTYYYQARSNGKPVPPTPFTILGGNAVGTSDFGLATGGPYSFTAPHPPPGRFLFSIVLCNDLHMGETQAGLVGGLPFIGIQQEPGLPPYPEVMLEALVHDASALDASYLLAAGDISAEAVPGDLSRAGQLLQRFGKYRRDVFVTRGNHDRAHDGDPWSTCTVGQWQGNDCFHDRFFPGDQPSYFTRELQGLRVIGIDTYDKPGGGGDAGALSTDQFAWFREQLAHERHQPTIVVGHHPLGQQHARHHAGGDHSRRLRAHAGHVPASRRPHAPQQAHDQPHRAEGPAPGDRRGQGVSGRLLVAASAHAGLCTELLQDAQRSGARVERAEPPGDRRSLAAVLARQPGLRPQRRRAARPVGAARASRRPRAFPRTLPRALARVSAPGRRDQLRRGDRGLYAYARRMRVLGLVREVVLDPDRPDVFPGCDAQHGAINDYGARHGWDIVDVVNASAPGPSDDAREDVLVRLARGDADVLVVALADIVWSDSRERRGFLERSRREGWHLVITGVGLDSTTAGGRALVDELLAGPPLDVPPCSQPVPPVGLVARVTGTYDLECFDVSAHEDLVLLEAALGEPLATRHDILDFGCGCGRLLRRLFDDMPGASLAGCDIDPDAIAWLAGNIADIDARVCAPLPPLPFADDAFDLVIGYSVLTHLDERYQDAWLAELRRVLRSGGVALLTVHGPGSWERVVCTALAGRPELERLQRERQTRGIVHWRDDGWEAVFPDFYHTTFHTPEYIERHWAAWFDQVEVVAGNAARDDDIVVARVAK
jgi:Icc protein